MISNDHYHRKLERTVGRLTERYGARNVDYVLGSAFYVIDPDNLKKPVVPENLDPRVKEAMGHLVEGKRVVERPSFTDIAEFLQGAHKAAEGSAVRFAFSIPCTLDADPDNFAYGLGQEVRLAKSKERGDIIGRAEYLGTERQYQVRYKAGDGRQVEEWWAESAIREI